MTNLRDLAKQFVPLISELQEKHSGDKLRAAHRFPLAYTTYGASEISLALACLITERTTMSSLVQEFESSFVEHALGSGTGVLDRNLAAVFVNSGSSADLLSVLALRQESGGPLPAGSKIGVPAVTWSTHLWSVILAGFEPVLIDVDPATFNIDFPSLERACKNGLSALFVVHLMGFPVDMTELQHILTSHGVLLLEDCCESFDASTPIGKVGTASEFGTFSFFYSHHMTTMEGGLVLAKSEYADKLRLLRAHGWTRNIGGLDVRPSDGIDSRYVFASWGLNVRPTELNAAFGLLQLERVNAQNYERRRNYETLRQNLEAYCPNVRFPSCPKDHLSNPFAVAFLVPAKERESIKAALEERGVETRNLVAGNLARHPAAERHGLSHAGLPGADELHFRGLYIGLPPFRDDALVDSLSNELCEVISKPI